MPADAAPPNSPRGDSDRRRHVWVLGLFLAGLGSVWLAWPGPTRPSILLPVALFATGLLGEVAERRCPCPSKRYSLSNFAVIFVAMCLTHHFMPGRMFSGWSFGIVVAALVAGNSAWNLIRPAPVPRQDT